MIYLITGGCGFLGSNIASELLKNNNKVIVFDNLSRLGSGNNLEWLVQQGLSDFIHGDIRQYLDIKNVIEKYQPDIVYHLAGQVAMTTSIREPYYDFQINVIGTLNLLESVRKYSPSSMIIYSSSNKVYGDLDELNYVESRTRYSIFEDKWLGFDENLPIRFQSPYGCSKATADQYMIEYANTFSLNTVVFRHSSIFGYRQFSSFDQGWIGWFIKEALKFKNNEISSIDISGNGKQVRDILFSEDLVDCYLAASKNIDSIKGRAYNIGGGIENSMSLIELFEFLSDELNSNLKITNNKVRIYDQKIFVANNSRATIDFKWKTKNNKFNGIKKMIDWIVNG